MKQTILFIKQGITSLSFIIFFVIFISSCHSEKSQESDLIRFNQLGFFPSEEKTAVVLSEEFGGKAFTIRTYDSGRIVYQGNLSDIRHSEFSNKKTSVLSFTEFSQPGIYLIDVPGLGRSLPFEIRDGLLSDLANASLKAFYYQRASTPIEELYAGKWARPSGHPDDHILVHSSAASSLRPEGTVISSPKGWYDTGDYNKYMVNSGFTLGVLLSLYEDYPDYMKPIRTQIPESTNQTPDLLDEIYWNLEWMLTMQDPADGGVYHKLTNPEFEGFIKPTDCKKQRYVVAKSVTAALILPHLWLRRQEYTENMRKTIREWRKLL